MLLVLMLRITFPSLCLPRSDLLLMYVEKPLGKMSMSQEGVVLVSTMTEKATISPPVLVSKAFSTATSDPSSG